MVMRICFVILILTTVVISNGQTNFRSGLEAIDPVSKDSILELEAKLAIHQRFLNQAVEDKNILKQIYGNVYLYYDYILAEDYSSPEKYILEAKRLADQSGNKGWQGWVGYRSGILYVRTNNVDGSIEAYKAAAALCEEAGDSLCVGECYEQLCIMTGLAKNYEEAQSYFNKALPLLKTYGKPKNLCTAYCNYGSLVSMMGKQEEAISLFLISLDYCGSIKRFDAQASSMNNLANAYRKQGDFKKAVEMYEAGLEFNKKHNFSRIMISNYMGLYYTHKEAGNYDLASENLIKRYELKDSLMGAEVQEKVAKLESNFENQNKELQIQKGKTELLAAQNRIRLIWIGLTFLSFIGGLFIWSYYKKRQRLKLQLIEHQRNLDLLTQTLIRKNEGIKILEEQLAKVSNLDESSSNIEVEENIFGQTILSADDWSAFKVNFDKAHPRYILRLRKSYALSEAEERLFLLLKLKLTRNEIASILGVSPDTVKKTRSRLRKRLNLEQVVSLDNFANKF